MTEEAYLFRDIFEEHFPQASARATVPGGPSVACSTAAAIEWDKAWAKLLDPSGLFFFFFFQYLFVDTYIYLLLTFVLDLHMVKIYNQAN